MFFAPSLRGFQQTSPKGLRSAKPASAAQAEMRFLQFMQLIPKEKIREKVLYGP